MKPGNTQRLEWQLGHLLSPSEVVQTHNLREALNLASITANED